MVIRQHFDPFSTRTATCWSIQTAGEVVLIDPCWSQHVRDAALIRELGVRLVATLDTHCHANHVTGAWAHEGGLRKSHRARRAYGARNVDLPLRPGMVVRFGAAAVEVRATPGHTSGCLSFVTPDRCHVFTGDALLIRAAGRTDFQEGNARQLFESVHAQLFTLPDDCVVHPGHDYEGRTSSTIGEERRHNPRPGRWGEARRTSSATWDNLGLPHPKLLDVAVPANLSAGRDAPGSSPAPAAWGPVVETYGRGPGNPARLARSPSRRGRGGRRPLALRVRRGARTPARSQAPSPRRAEGPEMDDLGVQAGGAHLPDRKALGDGGDHPRARLGSSAWPTSPAGWCAGASSAFRAESRPFGRQLAGAGPIASATSSAMSFTLMFSSRPVSFTASRSIVDAERAGHRHRALPPGPL